MSSEDLLSSQLELEKRPTSRGATSLIDLFIDF